MTRRNAPLQARFPGKTVFRLQVWFQSFRIKSEGPIAPELARLLVAAVVAWSPSPAVLARAAALADELQGIKRPPSDRELRRKVSVARAEKKIGRKS